MLDFRWVRGKIMRGRLLNFHGAGKGLAVKGSAGNKLAGNYPRTVLGAGVIPRIHLPRLKFPRQCVHRIVILD